MAKHRRNTGKYGYIEFVDKRKLNYDGWDDNIDPEIRKPTPAERKEIILNFIKANDGEIVPISFFAKWLAVSERTIQKTLRELEKEGEIQITPTKLVKGQQGANCYSYIGDSPEVTGLTFAKLYDADNPGGIRSWNWKEHKFIPGVYYPSEEKWWITQQYEELLGHRYYNKKARKKLRTKEQQFKLAIQNVLNVVSGMAMLSQRRKYKMVGKIVAFNEAMVDGNPTKNIFSEEFIAERCKTHVETRENYQTITMDFVEQITADKNIRLYFDTDMFCQINLLTVLAYLEQIGYNKPVKIYLCDERQQMVTSTISVRVHGMHQLYTQIVVERKKIKTPNEYLNSVLDLYFNYVNKDKDVLEQLLTGCTATDMQGKVDYLLQKDTNYGLGNTQWQRWIEMNL